jgi:hypothetical protein
MSPLSSKSKLTSKGQGTEKGTAYPPLPDSRLGDGDSQFDILSSPKPKSYAKSKAPSVSPSDSLSQIKGPQSRPFSPYRLGPTYEDLTYAAVRGRALPILEVDERQPTEATPSLRHSKAPSAVPSRASHVPSQADKPPTQVSASKAPSMEPSMRSQGSKIDKESNATPLPPRPQSPLDLDQEEAKIVRDALASKTPRTSYYASTALDPDATNHYHDFELCILLHQESEPTQHEFVKRALRKAVKQRVKKLGMKYDNEVSLRHRCSDDPSTNMPSSL